MIATLHTFYFYLDTLAIISDDSFTIFSYVFKLLAPSPIFQSSVDNRGYFNENRKNRSNQETNSTLTHPQILLACISTHICSLLFYY